MTSVIDVVTIDNTTTPFEYHTYFCTENKSRYNKLQRMERESEMVGRNRLWRMVSRIFSTKNVGALIREFQSIFTCCAGKKAASVSKTESYTYTQSGTSGKQGHLTNQQLLRELTKLESRFQRQNKLLNQHGLRKVMVAPGPIKLVKRYHGNIEPGLSDELKPDDKPDPLCLLLDKVKPDRYDDERFEELERLVQKFMMTRASRGVQGNSARPVRKEGLYIT